MSSSLHSSNNCFIVFVPVIVVDAEVVAAAANAVFVGVEAMMLMAGCVVGAAAESTVASFLLSMEVSKDASLAID